MKIQYGRFLTAAGLLSAAVLIAAPAAGAKHQNTAKADLATQRITLGAKYVVVKPSGKATAPISVTVSIRNIGRATAPATETRIKLLQGTHPVAAETIPLPRLAPGHASTQIVIFRDAEPQLGHLRAAAKADASNIAPGSLENDFRATPDIPVIAQRWTGVMDSDVHSPGIFGATEDDHATTPQEVVFTFSHRDAIRFVYAVGGEVEQTATFSGGGCTAQGEGSATMARWGADSGLFVSRDLKQYEATVRSSLGSPFTVMVSCPGFPVPAPATIKLKDLLTETSTAGGLAPMTARTHVLSGHGHLGSIITVDYTWHLVAEVP